jgi:8-oxo-dGTP pyrophosphatase MutT (NUDIX family)
MASWLLEIQRRLASPPPRRLAAAEVRASAVLVPLYVDGGELWTVLTRRTDDLPSHRGQYAFPGGGCETGEEAWDAALREANEELGLEGKRVMRLGELDEVDTSTGYRIVPCVGAVPFPLETRPNPLEIAEVFPLPLSAFANPHAVEERAVTIDGTARTLRVYHVGSRAVWGATARILQNLLQRLGMEGEGAMVDEDDDGGPVIA